MATQQYLERPSLHNTPLEDNNTKDSKPSSTPSGGFDCNICLDAVQDPVVTVCGHLYCWPCIYKWIHQQSISPEIPQCPVCKSEVSEGTLIPLYGRGQSGEKAKPFVVPRRPIQRTTQRNDSRRSNEQDAYYQDYVGYDYSSAPTISLAGSTTFQPMISMVGEMICMRLFGSSRPFYTIPNSYGVVVAGNSRARRNVIQADQSLSRLSIFLFCCLVLCLVFF